MARIRIEDLDEDQRIGKEEMRRVFGGNVDLQNMLQHRNRPIRGGSKSPFRQRKPTTIKQSYPGIVTPNC